MRLVLLAIAVSVAGGYALGGRLRNVAGARLRAPHLVVAGLLAQVLPVPGGRSPLAIGLLLLSFALLLAFALANLRTAGFALVAVGVAMNFAVIAANRGMPVSRAALVESGQADTLRLLLDDGGAKHRLATPGDRLAPLGDWISLGEGLEQVVSPGDIATYAGVAWFLVAGMRRPRGAAPPAVAAAPAAGPAAVRSRGSG